MAAVLTVGRLGVFTTLAALRDTAGDAPTLGCIDEVEMSDPFEKLVRGCRAATVLRRSGFIRSDVKLLMLEC